MEGDPGPDGYPAPGADARVWTQSIEAALHEVVSAGGPEQGLAAAARLVRYAEHLTADLVDEARARDVSWQRIGDALGITRQAANERYSPAGKQGAAARRYRRMRRLEAMRSAQAGGTPESS